MVNRKVPYLLGQGPQPVGLQQQEGETGREERTPDQQKPKTINTDTQTKQPNNKNGMKKREGWEGRCRKQRTK